MQAELTLHFIEKFVMSDDSEFKRFAVEIIKLHYLDKKMSNKGGIDYADFVQIFTGDTIDFFILDSLVMINNAMVTKNPCKYILSEGV